MTHTATLITSYACTWERNCLILWAVARTTCPCFDPYLKERRMRRTYISNWIAVTNFTIPAGYEQGTPAVHHWWSSYRDIGICCLMHCRPKFVYCSNDCGIEISVWHSNLSINHPAFQKEQQWSWMDIYCLLSLPMQEVMAASWSWRQSSKNKQ